MSMTLFCDELKGNCKGALTASVDELVLIEETDMVK